MTAPCVSTKAVTKTLQQCGLTQADVDAICCAKHNNPHHVLGLHPKNVGGYLVINVFLPNAQSVDIIDVKTHKSLATLRKVNTSGFFCALIKRKKQFEYQLNITTNINGISTQSLIDDPFSFEHTLGELDIYLLNEGKHQKPYNILGAHVTEQSNTKGVTFTVWAPNASHVSVVSDFNEWDGRIHPLNNVVHHNSPSGYWTIFIPHVTAGALYKFEIKDRNGNVLPLKSDPYGVQSQYRPDTASIVSEKIDFAWQDDTWLQEREQRNSIQAPISIYEVHLGSWKRDKNNGYLNYKDIAAELIPYVLTMGFTHIQLMPVSEYPFDGSWGYQPVGLFAPTSRFGTAEDFTFFVNACHHAGIGLLIDWVPGHFPSDPHGLVAFDGSCLYEHQDPKKGFHPDWNTLIYNYGRTEVCNFLKASALHWLDNYHIDGIRVDAVASMLYLDYSRKAGEWIPNEHGGRENLEAINFLQSFNEELYSQYPGTFSVAEESTSWPGVSHPTNQGGLGFGYKWNMGWMNDTLRYMQEDPINRSHHHDAISFGLVYAFDENFILPLSHDEVVHEKGSILAKMPGDAWQQFANLRAYYGFMWAHPGKKLLFMGCEFGQGKEWDHDQALDWHQLDIHWHSGVQTLVKDLNKVYTNTPALFEKDCDSSGFEWLDHKNVKESVYSFIRYGNNRQQPVIVICNFTPKVHHNFTVGVPVPGNYKQLINTDLAQYGGSDQGNTLEVASNSMACHGQKHSINITVPPLSTLILALSVTGSANNE